MIDLNSPSVRQIRADVQEEIERLRELNDAQTKTHDETQHLRGRIAGLKFVIKKLSPTEDKSNG